MAAVLITGANRGIGLGLVRAFLASDWKVIATCRNPDTASDLQSLKNTSGDSLSIVALDVDDQDGIDRAVRDLEGVPLDVIINNAGIVEQEGYGSGAYEGIDDPDLRKYNYDQWEAILRTNVLGPARISGSFVENLKLGDNPRIVMMTSGLASIANTWQAGRYAYRTSKAALNMLMRSSGEWFESLGITAVAISPGWTRTDMGGPNASNSVEDAASGVFKVIDGLNKDDAGKFLNFDGTTLPW